MAMNISENSKNGFKMHEHTETNGKLNGNHGSKNLPSEECHNSNGTTKANHLNNVAKNFSQGQKDILRLIGQHLRSLGLNKTTESLMNESGCMLEHPTASNFRNLIMNGKWQEAEAALESLKSFIDDSSDFTKMKFLILEQKYLECLEDSQIMEALKCLRDELAPLKFNTERLHELSSFLMCTDQNNLKILSNWAGKNDISRKILMDKLQTFLPPNIMLPPHRLETLLNQAVEYQCEQCPYHNYKDKFHIDDWSFLRDHICSKDDFPSICIQVYNDHCDEVWYCKFSNNGKLLATGSKDGCLIIWDVDPDTYKLTINKTYDEHTHGASVVVWSPDDQYLIVCGTEDCSEIWIWDIENKVLKKRINNNHDDSIITAAWMPDGQAFVCGGTKGHFYYCDIDGTIKETWEGVRVRCLQTLPDGQALCADTLKRIRSYNFKELTDSNLIQEDFQIVSFTLNKAGTQLLVSAAAQGIHLWDVKDKMLIRRFQGSVQNTYMNYATFGGADEIYIASGSEDNKVYVWNIKKEHPIAVLEGHTRNVTCVTWNPELPGMIVSASDDGTIRVWGPKNKFSLDSNGFQSEPECMNGFSSTRTDRSTPV
ncbi:WD repeat-containing 26-like [Brachionus plicatilis]|uniref:WD repeat-containing 26-like n=1 Tax=Brachionus plicatilis TaxID=10195 RepID=A0A3M7PXM9_BRAPC|nr:WD repeat-containing 26-like [Brachionus plicatilis]